MAEDTGEDEGKFDPFGQRYIGLEEARLRAMEDARDNIDLYGTGYSGMNLAW